MRRSIFLALACSWLLAACGNKDLPDYFQLGSLRVLAILAEDPGTATPLSEVDPSTSPTVRLTPVISALNAGNALGDRTQDLQLKYTWRACIDPGVQLGQEPSCDGVPGATTQTTVNAVLPTAGGAYTGTLSTGTTFDVTVPSSLFVSPLNTAQLRSDRERYNGVAYLVTVDVTAGNTGETARSFRRLIGTTRASRNSVPTVTGVLVEGTGSPIASLPGAETRLGPQFNGTPETYTLQAVDGSLISLTEDFTVTWFLGRGSLKYSRTDGSSLNTWTPGDGTHPAFLVVLLRDGRGGVSWTKVGP